MLPIKKIQEGIIDFYGEGDSEASLQQLNLDFSHSEGRLYPRYRIYTTDLDSYYADAGTLLNIQNTTLKGLKVSNILVKGNYGASPLINSNSFYSETLNIINCTFSNIKGTVIYAQDTPDLNVEDCMFNKCSADGIISENGCLRTVARNNSFWNIGDGMLQSFAIVCRGTDFLIEANDISRFHFGGIGVGLWYGIYHTQPITGKVRYNTIAMDGYGMAYYEWVTHLAGSAIYSWTQTDGVEITENEISNIRGILGTTAIFGECGSKNLTITYNNIFEIYPNKFGFQPFSIDVMWNNAAEPYVMDHNTNNDHYGNTYDGDEITCDWLYGVIRFERTDPSAAFAPASESGSIAPAEGPRDINSPFQNYDLYGNPTNNANGFSVVQKANKAVIRQ